MTDARIAAGGYRRFVGDRGGARTAFKSVLVNTVDRTLGMRRSFWAKVLPFFMLLLALLPAFVFIGVTAFLPDQLREEFVPRYHQYYGFITVAVLIFTSLIAPEALCPDRRSGVLALYLASPLNPRTYVLARLSGVMSVIVGITFLPLLILLIGLSVQNAGPDGFGNFMLTLARMIASSVVMALAYGLVALAVSSLTDRRAFASAGIVFLLIATGTASDLLVGPLNAPLWLHLLDIFQLPNELVLRIWGTHEMFGVETWTVALGTVFWSLTSALLLEWRYRGGVTR